MTLGRQKKCLRPQSLKETRLVLSEVTLLKWASLMDKKKNLGKKIEKNRRQSLNLSLKNTLSIPYPV